MTAPDSIKRLVEIFDNNIESYKTSGYNETQVRQEFIDPLFIALGWDVYNSQGYAEAYKDVVLEDKIRVGSATKAPDYSFRIGGVRKFFLEAKKPMVDIKHDIHPAYQLRRYAWSAKLPVSVLTDFEEFSIYDCKVRPGKTDNAAVARIRYFKYTEYIENWEELYSVFSKDAILKGSFDKYAAATKKKRGTAEVDDAFLQEMEEWRNLLARNFALRNPELSVRALNEAVQKTIDRIVFLRICEDRGIEPYGQLQKLLNVSDVYSHLRQIFLRADDKYNSGLFHFRNEKGRDDHDTFTLKQTLDDKPLKEILKRMYYPDSPYEFSVLPADILGHVYERFLGKVIRLTAGHQAKIEEKPEVRKAGGVYYTPTYIVDYIVKNTVGKLLENSTPKKAEKLRILDPACGSGSFLLGAYQYMIDWHLKEYMKKAEKYSKGKNTVIYQTRDKEWRLTTAERKKILTNNIYGVDIDSQAVEVTKLSLLLKVLEGESDETLSQQLMMFAERALPDLDSNIKCGNSLIGPDFYNDKPLQMFDEEEMYRVNVFDWQEEFPEIFPEKELTVYHVTWVAHNTRESERMKAFRDVIEKRRRLRGLSGESILVNLASEQGVDTPCQSETGHATSGKSLHGKGLQPLVRSGDDIEEFITSVIADTVRKDNLRVLAYNICGDHVHILLVCDEKDLSNIVRKLKGKTSQEVKNWLEIDKEEEFHLWGQKFNKAVISGDEQLRNTIEYIENNRTKHELPPCKGLKPLVRKMLTPLNKAFEPMKAGGFDAVIGNPPYIKTQNMKEYAPHEVEHYKSKYSAASSGNFDIYLLFVEKFMKLISQNGILGYILPHKFFNSSYGKILRSQIINSKSIDKILHFDDYQIFKDASTYTCLLFISHNSDDYFLAHKIDTTFNPCDIQNLEYMKIPFSEWHNSDWTIIDKKKKGVQEKLNSMTKLCDITTNIFQGPKSGADNVFILKYLSESENYYSLYSKLLDKNFDIEKSICRKYVKGKFISRYIIQGRTKEITIYPYDKKGKLFDISKIKSLFPKTHLFLNIDENKKILRARERGRYINNWWTYSRPQNMGIIHKKKLLTPFNAFAPSFSYDNECDFIFSAGVSGAYGILFKENIHESYQYFLGLLNSKLLFFYLKNISTSLRGGFYSFENKYISQLPIRTIDFDNPEDLAMHDKMVSMVENMLELNKRVNSEGISSQEKKVLQTQIKVTDKAIDQLVYELYGLTNEEIAVVEGEE